MWHTEALGCRGLSLFEPPYRVPGASDGVVEVADEVAAVSGGVLAGPDGGREVTGVVGWVALRPNQPAQSGRHPGR